MCLFFACGSVHGMSKRCCRYWGWANILATGWRSADSSEEKQSLKTWSQIKRNTKQLKSQRIPTRHLFLIQKIHLKEFFSFVETKIFALTAFAKTWRLLGLSDDFFWQKVLLSAMPPLFVLERQEHNLWPDLSGQQTTVLYWHPPHSKDQAYCTFLNRFAQNPH